MKWVPAWLAKSYANLYSEKHAEWFEFEEAIKILSIEDKSMVSRTLTRLQESGFLISKRDSVDRRKKYFRLIGPEDAVSAYGMQPRMEPGALMDRLVAASRFMDFVIAGAYAAFVHSGYASPGKIDIYVKKEDLGKWVALISGKSTSASIDDILSERKAKENVHLHSMLTKEMIDASVLIDGIRYIAAENLVIDSLKEQTELSMTDAFAVLIRKRREMNFDRLLKLAKNEALEKELGASMEILNSESKRKVFNPVVISKIHSRIDRSRRRFFPREKTEETIEYKRISEKWALRISLSRALVSKIVTDLVR